MIVRLTVPVDDALRSIPALHRNQTAFLRACSPSLAAIPAANLGADSVATCTDGALRIALVHALDPLTTVTFDVGPWEIEACAVGMYDPLRERFAREQGRAFYGAVAEYVVHMLHGRFRKVITYADDVPVRADLSWEDDRYARRAYIPSPDAYRAQMAGAHRVRTTTFAYVAFVGNRRPAPRPLLTPP